MRSNADSVICAATCWGIGLLAAVLSFVLLTVAGEWTIIQGIFAAGLIFLVAGGALSFLFCRPLPAPASVRDAVKTTGATAAKPAPTPATQPKPAAKPAPTPAPATAAAAKPTPAPASGTKDGAKPAGLKAARGGTADDLKKIKGVGPKLEQQLHSLGYFHFDQIANWTPAEVAWVDENLQGFKGRVSRDNWVEQATLLAAGGETEFSKKVGKGDVY